MQFHQRLIRGLVSSFAARSISVVSQLVTVPVLARAWGVSVYGQYLTMVALASYVSVATLGVHQAALSEMAIAHARDDTDGYSNALRGLFQVILAVSLATLFAQISMAFFAPTAALLHQSGHLIGGGHYAVRGAIFLIGVQAILAQNFGVVTNGIAALGRYGEAQACETLKLAVESICLWVGVLALGFAPDTAAAVSVGIGVAAVVLVWVRLKILEPDRVRLWAPVDWSTFAQLWKPTMGNFAIGTAFQTLVVQAPRLILAAVVGSTTVALFSITWALMGVIRQAYEVVIHPLAVEFAFAFGVNDKARATDMLALGTTVATGLTGLACVPVILLGPWIITLATKGQIAAPHLLVGMLWGVLAINSAAICFQAALQSSNQSYHTLWPLTLDGALFLALAFFLARQYGAYGLASALLIFQTGFSFVMVRWTCRAFDLRLSDVLVRAVSPQALVRLARSAVTRGAGR